MPSTFENRFHDDLVERHTPGDDDATTAGATRDFAVVVLLALLGITLSAAVLNSGIIVPDLSDMAAFLG
jgi:hypothetical protein